MKKKLLALLLSAAMVGTAGALAACNQETDPCADGHDFVDGVCSRCDEADPNYNNNNNNNEEHEITEGYFSYSYNADGVGALTRYLHFYEDVGLGSVVYLGAINGSYGASGSIAFYEVEEKDYSYAVWAERADVTKDETTQEIDTTSATKGTAPYTITFTSTTDGAVLGTCGYDGSKLYTGNPGQIGYFPAAATTDSHNLIYPQDVEGTKYPAAYGQEVAVELITYYTVANADDQVLIFHDGTYATAFGTDIAGGTYTYANGVFTLSAGGTVTVSESGIIYKKGDTEIELTTEATAAAKTLVIALEGTASSSYGFSAAVKLAFYDDGTCEFIATVQGADNVLDSGTYTTNAMGIPEKATLETAGEVTISVDFGTMELSAEIPAYAASGFDACTVKASLGGGEEPEPVEKVVLITLNGTSHSSYGFDAPIKLVLYTDGTCDVIVTVQGNDAVIDSGTYATDSYGMGLPVSATLTTAGEVAINSDFTNFVFSAELPAYAEQGFEACTVSCPITM